jgi:hypothetical protein
MLLDGGGWLLGTSLAVTQVLRRVIAVGALGLAGVLFYFEVIRHGGSDSWFWILVAVFAAALGIAELVSPRAQK